VVMAERDYLATLYALVDALNTRFPLGNEPFQMMTRIAEEVGELAQAVNHRERAGAKVEKHGPPDTAKLADEVHHVIRAALSVARYYGIERELENSIDASYEWHRTHGFLVDA